jgi:uncharacterized protein (TIGR00730 family)
MNTEHQKHNPEKTWRKDIHKGDIDTHLWRINHEFKEGFAFIQKFPRSVTVFGSSMLKQDSETYKQAEIVASKISSELNYAVITGGGPGIMEAANKGAREAGGRSEGLTVSLPHERKVNGYTTGSTRFSYFFVRKTILTFAAEAYIFFPGGFGTFDELFSILTLIQTGKIPKVPIILFGSKFWDNLKAFIKKSMLEDYKTIDPENLNLFEITDSPDRVVEIIKTAPVYDWWRNIN